MTHPDLVPSEDAATPDARGRVRAPLVFGGLMIQTTIHKNVRLAEAASASQPIIEFDASAPGAFDFLKLTKELLSEYEPETEKRTAKRAK